MAKRRRKKNNWLRAVNPLHDNPLGTTVAVVLGVAALGTAAGFGIRHIVRKRQEKKAAAKKMLPPSQVLTKYVKPVATLGESSFVLNDVMQPIFLRTTVEDPTDGTFDYVPRLSVWPPPQGAEIVAKMGIFGALLNQVGQIKPDEGHVQMMDENLKVQWGWTDPQVKAIGILVTNVSGDFTRDAYERALARISGGTDWKNDVDRASAVRSILTTMVPEVDWTTVQPFSVSPDDPVAIIWDAVDVIGTVAYQSWWNKQFKQGQHPPGPLPPKGVAPPPPFSVVMN